MDTYGNTKLMYKLPVNKYVIVGSAVLGIRFEKDIDIIAYIDDIKVETTGDDYIRVFNFQGKKVEILIADNQESLKYILN